MPVSAEHIYLLWLILLIPIAIGIFLYTLFKKKQVAKKIGEANLVQLLLKNYNHKAYIKKFLMLTFALLFVILATINLRLKTGTNKITKNGIDIIIALDVSKSMLAKDIQPNRLERAKQLLSKLIDKLSNDRIGIIIFAGKAYLQMPLTGDHSASKMYLNAASCDAVPVQGTAIGEALKMSYAAFNTKEKKYKAVILLSDGEDHDEDATAIAKEMAQQGIIINTVGIGSVEGSAIIEEKTGEEKKDKDGNTVITKLNEEELTNIAKYASGIYQQFTNTDAVVNNLFNQLSTMDKRSVEDKSLNNYKSLFQLLLGVAFILLLIEIFLAETTKKKSVNIKQLITGLFIFISTSIFAQAENVNIKKGNEAYKKSNFEAAITQYLDATKVNDKNTKAHFNLGNALYKTDKKDDAIVAYDKVASEATNSLEKTNALYNKGVVLQKSKKLQECIAAYKKALLQDATNADARHNLQIALQQQKQQQEKEKKEKEKEKQKENSNKDKKDDKQPKPQQSNINKQDAEQKLNALQQKEKELQDKMHKAGKGNSNKVEKDW